MFLIRKNKLLFFIVVIVNLTISVTSLAQSRIPYPIIPQPKTAVMLPEIFELTEDVEIVSNEYCMPEARFFAAWLTQATGKKYEVLAAESWRYSKPFILFKSEKTREGKLSIIDMEYLNPDYAALAESSPREAYTINASTRGISVSATEPIGIFHAVQTLRQMFPAQAEAGNLMLPFQLTCMRIHDEPKFSHRGMLLDCCRHFMTVDFIKKYIDLLSYYKMNVLHWHLTEDQGWRIEIEKYPELTKVGAWRTEADGSTYGGFYKKSEIKDIVAYAASRHITIIPEIEMPGHSVAAIASYPWLGCTKEHIPVENQWGVFKDIYCAGNDSTFTFLENVLDEICELFPGPYIHIGGDEAPKYRWEHCEKCQRRMEKEGLQNEAELQTYFINRIAAYLQTKNKEIIGWDEILEGGIPNGAMIQSWRGMQGGIDAAKAKHGVVMSPTSHCYFDYSIKSIDTEKVYSFNPIPDSLGAEEAAYIKGGECNMWTEHAPQERVDQMIFPRMPALAEVLWTYHTDRQYIEFESRLNKHYALWDEMDVNYGFAKMPILFHTKIDGKNIIVDLEKNPSDLIVKYGFHEYKMNTSFNEPLTLSKPTHIFAEATSPTGKAYPERFELLVWPNPAMGQALQLNYTPSPYYTGGGTDALVDGVLGGNNFRDGHWQASTQGDLQALITLAESTEISTFSVNAYHYANAWIFRPESVIFEYSEDGINWMVAGEDLAPYSAETSGEDIVNYTITLNTKVPARFIRVTAKSIGPCPEWHDAVGEPSWIFWDEIVVGS